MRYLLATALMGTALGFVLSRIGFSSWDEVHRMFTFESLRLLLTFALGVSLLSIAWPIIRRLSANPPRWSRRPIHRGTAVGGALFGVGWALCGACPSIALVQLGEGKSSALISLAGMFLGNWLYSVVHERYFRWSAGSCVDD
jgi:uncharacterized membrane protein YedE/YeeE